MERLGGGVWGGVIAPLASVYVGFLAMLFLHRRWGGRDRRPRGAPARWRALPRHLAATAPQGWLAFMAIIFVFSFMFAEQQQAIAEALTGGTLLAVVGTLGLALLGWAEGVIRGRRTKSPPSDGGSGRGEVRGSLFDPSPGGGGSVDAMARDERWKIVDGRLMFARTWNLHHPTAPTVVLVPGLVVSGASVGPTAERLARSFQVLAPDLPGTGLSERPPKPLRVPELADAVIGWMAAMGLDGARVVATSFGCQVAAELALRRPDLVARLVLASPTLDPAARTVPRVLGRWFLESLTQSLRYRRLLVSEYRRARLGRAMAMLRLALRDRIEDKLHLIDAPTLVVRGTRDPIVPQRWASEVASRVPDARLVTLPGVPHAMNFEAPARFVRAVVPFLSAPTGGLGR